METINIKTCSRCKKTKNIIEFTKCNNILKMCLRCRNICKKSSNKNKCQHNRIKSYCKECGGSQICEHNRLKNTCKECGGYGRCEHNRVKYTCKECGGSQICEHNRRKNICKECGGSSICEHNRQKQNCKECGGSSICEHNKHKYYCKICGDEIKITINKMINDSKKSDKKHNRYDQTNFIDNCFVKNLIEDCEDKCYYCNCELQYIYFTGNLATIERLNNDLGHIKGNCVIACRTCNYSRIGNKINF